MRFMLFVYPDVDVAAEEWTPGEDDAARMNVFNEELSKAGVLLSLDGLHPPVEGARVRFSGAKASVTDGPFAEAKEVVGGYWVIDVKDKAEAVEWASRAPMADGDMIEVRRVFEMADFPEAVQAAATMSEQPPEQSAAR